ALVLTTLPTPAEQVAYIALFGLGSTMGMAVLSGVVGWPVARLASRRSVGRHLSATVGGFSLGLGLMWGYPLVFRLLLPEFNPRAPGRPARLRFRRRAAPRPTLCDRRPAPRRVAMPCREAPSLS